MVMVFVFNFAMLLTVTAVKPVKFYTDFIQESPIGLRA